MEWKGSSSKRRGLITRSKLIMSIYRATKPASSTNTSSAAALIQPYSSNSCSGSGNGNNKPNPNSNSATGLIIHVNQQLDQAAVFPHHQKPKVAFHVVPSTDKQQYGSVENLNYGDVDEAVDAKAARYISSVQERFRLERVNSERINIQDLQL